MATSSDKTPARKHSQDLTDCSICMKPLTDPRSLPCLHTYCLKCIDGWCKKAKNGKNGSCPLCRKVFTVPIGGADSLPKNFFLEQMLHVKQLASVQQENLVCDVCNDGNEHANSNTAIMYCVDCDEKYCDSCVAVHRKQKISSAHKLIELGKQSNFDELVMNAIALRCDKHTDEKLNLFCTKCQAAICVLCFVKLHKDHECSDFGALAAEFKGQMVRDEEAMQASVTKCSDFLIKLDALEQNFAKVVSDVENEVANTSKKLHQLIDSHEEKALNQLKTLSQSRTTQLCRLRTEIEQRMESLNNLQKYTRELRTKGAAPDIARQSSSLHGRSLELVASEQFKQEYDTMSSTNPTFAESFLHLRKDDNLIGNIVWTDRRPITSSGVIKPRDKNSQSISDITVLNKYLFVVRDDSTEIEMYDARTLKFLRKLSISHQSSSPNDSHYQRSFAWNAYGGEFGTWSLASCSVNDCLFAASQNTCIMYCWNQIMTSPTDWSVSTTWSLNESPAGLSVNGHHNVLVASSSSNNVYEYHHNGTLLRKIDLQTERQFRVNDLFAGEFCTDFSLSHVVQKSTGSFVVAYGQLNCLQRVGDVSADGRLLSSFSNCRDGNWSKQMPRQLAGRLLVDSKGNTMICEWQSGKIHVLDSALKWSSDLPLPANTDLRQPFALALNELDHRLFVADRVGGGRVYVFDRVQY